MSLLHYSVVQKVSHNQLVNKIVLKLPIRLDFHQICVQKIEYYQLLFSFYA